MPLILIIYDYLFWSYFFDFLTCCSSPWVLCLQAWRVVLAREMDVAFPDASEQELKVSCSTTRDFFRGQSVTPALARRDKHKMRLHSVQLTNYPYWQ